MRCFNPTLVRFCPDLQCPRERREHMFQSHLGSILPGIHSRRLCRYSKFQSHLGSILPEDEGEVDFWESRFNPTLVRFCQQLTAPEPPVWLRFNPTLVRFCQEKELNNGVQDIGFNPTLVRFCPVKSAVSALEIAVSIPPWFDFAPPSLGAAGVQIYGAFHDPDTPVLPFFCGRSSIVHLPLGIDGSC